MPPVTSDGVVCCPQNILLHNFIIHRLQGLKRCDVTNMISTTLAQLGSIALCAFLCYSLRLYNLVFSAYDFKYHFAYQVYLAFSIQYITYNISSWMRRTAKFIFYIEEANILVHLFFPEVSKRTMYGVSMGSFMRYVQYFSNS